MIEGIVLDRSDDEILDGIWDSLVRPDMFRKCRYAAQHSPVGGVTIGGTFYPGGQFIPGSVIASASTEELEDLEPIPQGIDLEGSGDMLVPPGNLGIPREEMPQIRSDLVGKFISEIKEGGVSVKTGSKRARDLKGMQSGISSDKVRSMADAPLEKLTAPVITSNDGYILDGHTRWARLMNDNPDAEINTVEVDLSARDLVERAKDFSEVSFKGLGETKSVREPSGPEEMDEWLSEVKRHPDVQRVLSEFSKRTGKLSEVTQWSLRQHTEGGRLTAEREKLHESIVDGILNPKAKAKEGERPKIVLMSGPPAAGKTTVVNKFVGPQMGVEFTTLNADDAKAALPEYEGWNAGLLHEESSIIVEEKAMSRAIQERHNLIFDATGNNAKKMAALAEKFGAKGYDVHLVNVSLPAHKSAFRAVNRFLSNPFKSVDPDGEPGRYVPPDYVFLGVDGKPDRTYNELKENPAIKSWMSVSTDVPRGTDPEILDRGER